MSSMPASTANWHWKNKNITSWSREWFERELATIVVRGDGEEEIAVTKVTDVEGDVELGQRKSKLITIYDCKIELDWAGKAEDGAEIKGKLTIPEVSHEITLDKLSDYVYEWSLTTAPSPVVTKAFNLAKALIPTALVTKFEAFPTTIMEIHGKDLQVSAEPSRTGTPVPTNSQSSAIKATSTTAPKVTAVKREEKAINTSNVTVEASFMASADDLFTMFTDEERIPMWTRAPAQSKPEVGGPFSMFGGGVKGSYVAVERPSKVVQKWALSSPAWPSDHFGTMNISFDQSSDSTKLVLRLDGVPKGMEEEIKRNIDGYYIHGLKSIGYVHVVASPSYSTVPRVGPPPRVSARTISSVGATVSTSSRTLVIVLAVAVLAAAFLVPFR